MKALASLVIAGAVIACSESTGPTLNPLPILEAVAPATITRGTGPVTVIVSGRGFVPGTKILIDGVERATSVQGSGQASTRLEALEVSVPRILGVATANPGPGGGTSGTVQVLVTNPTPAIDSIAPLLLAGGAPSTLVIHGKFFRTNSAVRWNGTDRPTRFVSDTQLEADLTAGDLTVAARVRLAVVNLALDGGMVEIRYPVYNPQPVVLGLSPGRAAVGGSGFTLTVTGEHFVPGAVILWNGTPHPAVYHDSNLLTVTISASDLASPGVAAVAVANPDPALAPSSDSSFRVLPNLVLRLHARDLAWDAVRGRLYASVLSDDVRFGNQVVAIDPTTGAIVDSVWAGLAPAQLAISDDASLLYVAVDGEAAVARIDLATFKRSLLFAVGSGTFETLWAGDMAVLPGAPHTLAVARYSPNFSPHQDGVALYDDGVMRSVVTPRVQGGNLIEAASPTTLYGYDSETSGFQLYRMDVADSGLTVRDATEGLVQQYYADIRYGSGYIFSTEGTAVDAVSGRLAATVGVQGLVCPEPAGGKVYYMTHATLYAVSTATWTLSGTQPSPPGADPSWYSVTRWGDDGFAYVGPTEVVIFHSDLVTR